MRAVDVLSNLVGDRHPETATVQMNLAVLYGRMKRTDEGLVLARGALAIHLQAFGEIHTKMEGNYNNMAKLLMAHGTATRDLKVMKEGLSMMKKCINVGEELHGHNHPPLAKLYATLGKTYFKMKKRDDALQYYQKAQAVIDSHPDNPELKKIQMQCEQVLSLLLRRSKSIREIEQKKKER